MQVRFQIWRQNQNAPPRFQTYTLEAEPTDTILTCLNRIKWEQDGSLAFRKNCRNTICGSCSMRINGRSALACKENVAGELARLPEDNPTMTIAPMGNMPVVKDLVVDMTSFWDNLEAIDPYVSTKGRTLPEREFLQSPEDREKLERSGNCILCGACYSECNAYEVNPNFAGPHALAKAQRMVFDNRDTNTEERLEHYDDKHSGVWGCTRCYYCNAVCPMDVAPMDRIGDIKREILQRKDDRASRPVRHRKVLVELVKQGGWLDERQFALKLISGTFEGWRDLTRYGALGLRMLRSSKIPASFEPSEGTEEVRGIIDRVRRIGGLGD